MFQEKWCYQVGLEGNILGLFQDKFLDFWTLPARCQTLIWDKSALSMHDPHPSALLPSQGSAGEWRFSGLNYTVPCSSFSEVHFSHADSPKWDFFNVNENSNEGIVCLKHSGHNGNWVMELQLFSTLSSCIFWQPERKKMRSLSLFAYHGGLK